MEFFGPSPVFFVFLKCGMMTALQGFETNSGFAELMQN